MYLIDTHVILWTLYTPEELPQKVQDIMDNEKCCFSIASLWEMAIKSSLKKLELAQTISEIAAALRDGGLQQRDITPEDCDCIQTLPFIHKDPFDRIIIAQAKTDALTIITKDSFIAQYDVDTIWG